MNMDETQREIMKLWEKWPERPRDGKLGPFGALPFFIWLQRENEWILNAGHFGSDKHYQIVSAWIDRLFEPSIVYRIEHFVPDERDPLKAGLR